MLNEKVKNYDVVVVGGGTAGIAAAAASARTGVKTALIESSYLLGGLATSGMVTFYLPLCDGMGNQLCHGISEELLKLSISHGAEGPLPEVWLCPATREKRDGKRYTVQYNPYVFAIEAERLLAKEGVDILYGGTLAKAYTSERGDRIEKIEVVTRTETLYYSAKSFIDCTGDATLCELSGEKTALPAHGNVLAAWYYEVRNGEYRIRQKGSGDLVYSTMQGDENAFDGLDSVKISEVMREAHGVMLDDFLSHGDGDRKHAMATVCTIPQVRMTRRLCGVFEMKKTDDKKRFENSVGAFGSWREYGLAYELPIDSLYGAKVKNLTVAGRLVSVENDDMWDITRVIPVCAVTGEAAGVIAAMYDDTDKIEVKKVQNELISRGVKLHLSDCIL